MKMTLFLLSLILLSVPAISQGKKYDKAMEAAMEQMRQAPDPVSELELAAGFEAIAKDYPDQWLPSYHASRIIITSSFIEPDSDKRDLMMERAGKSMDRARELAPGESEVEVLTALYYIGLISIDPDSRGPIYYQDAMEAIQKAMDLNPDNPRAHYMNATWMLNMPDFMGGGPDAARPLYLKAQEKFRDYRNEDPFWPDWGEELVGADLERIGE